jgi:glycosyltransferase involved in cell wall biosynthesis
LVRNITLFLNHLLDGGAARVAVNLTRAWAEMGRNVTLLTVDAGRNDAFYPVHPSARHQPLGLLADSANPLAAAARNLGRVWKLRQAIRASRPDLLVSFLDRNNVMALLACRTLPGLPVIVSERTDPSQRPIGYAWERLRRWTYPWADCLVVQSRHAMDYFPPAVRARTRVIANAVLAPALDGPPPPRGPRRMAVTMGRLHPVKGHDLLIEAFAALAGVRPEWDLAIYGEGPARADLEALVRERGLEGRVRLPGQTDQVEARLREADLFVLPSRAEGFPNALAEAMACGLPVVSFDCHSGPSELIRDGVDGVLVPAGDVAALSRAMAGLMAAPEQRARFAEAAPEVVTRFSEASILARWEDVIQDVVAGR